MRERTGKMLTCRACGSEYYVKKHRVEKSKYCSTYCLNKGQYPSIHKTCLHCQKRFSVSNSKFRQKYCSVDCRFAGKADIKEARRKQRISQQMKRGKNASRLYRKIAFTFKEHRCEICGYDEHDFCLDVHHIDGDPCNNHIENLAILCAICHRKLHKKKIELKQNKENPDSET